MPKQKIHIVHVITGLELGGAERSLYRLTRGIDKTRFRITVVSLSGAGSLEKVLVEDGIEVLPLRLVKKNPLTWLSIVKFWYWIWKQRPDLIQGWMYHGDLVATLVKITSPVKILVWNNRCSKLDFKYYSPLTRWIILLLARLSSFPHAIIHNSLAGRKSHEEMGFKNPHWTYIPNGLDLTEFQRSNESRKFWRTRLAVSDDEILIGMVARFDPMKGFYTLAAAIDIALKKASNLKFLIIGRGVDEQAFLRSLPQNKVILMGQQDQVHKIMNAFDISTSTSSFAEGFPNVIAEAMACGVPCVVTNVGDSSVIVGDTGRIVPPNDPQALVDAWLQRANQTAHDINDLSKKCQHQIQTQFSLETMTQRYESLYEKLFALNNHKSR